MIALVCGGVGGAKIALGLYRTLPPDSLSLIVNTADDTDVWGLHVAPDVDTVTYTLANLASEHGWGIRDDSFTALELMGSYGAPTWFQIGDRDLATHVYRTQALRAGARLTEVTGHIARSLGIHARVLPMTDSRVATRVRVGEEWLDFQEYFVHRRHDVPVDGVRYEGIEGTEVTEEVAAALDNAAAVILASSNPVLSILPILSVPGVREGLQERAVPRVAISPMIGGGSVTGPAGDLMRLVDQPSTSLGVARLYRGLIDGIVISDEDGALASEIEDLGIRVLCTDTLMRTDRDKERLARKTVAFAQSIR